MQEGIKSKEDINGGVKPAVESAKNKYSNPEELKKGDEKYMNMNKVLGVHESFQKAQNEGWLQGINLNNEIDGLMKDGNLTAEEMDAAKTVSNISDSIRRGIKNKLSTTLILNNLKLISHQDREKILLIEKKKRTNEGTGLRNILGNMGFEMSVGGMSKEEFEAAKERSKNVKIS